VELKAPAQTHLQKGQVVVEYVLLIMVIIFISAVLLKSLGSRNPDSPGIITGKWHQILESIAHDMID
jgi:hypothetical protein